MRTIAGVAFLVSVVFVSAVAEAQPLLRVPQVSPAARVEEAFGITDVAVSYHRPSVNKRKIWGGLVPYEVLWRAGANENTLITFSTPVTVEGQPLAAGTYSLFMIPSPTQWTVVFNRFTGGWGTYSYDPVQDVLRVKVTPQPAEMQERLAFTFDESTADAVTLSLRWEKLRVPIRIAAETIKLTMASMRDQLRSAYNWVPQAWREAAGYALRSNDLDAAQEFVDRSIALSADGMNLRTKARIMERKGDAAAAKELRARADTLFPADRAALNRAFEAIGAKKYDEAIAILDAHIAADPKAWRAYSALGIAYASKGDQIKARESFDKAMALAPSQSNRVEVQDAINDLAANPR